MIPRFFVSSTYYDLKHVRERLEKFIENYGFQPILFESDKVTYQHGKPIDQSAYFEVGLCHIMVLLIGGRYGTSSSQENIEEEWKLYDDNYISITRKEFETAVSKNIPIIIFIDKNVYAEYETYKGNQKFFDIEINSLKAGGFKFAHVDHINVFKFIDTVKSKPIKTFDKVEEIEGYLKSQLAGMFYLYLEDLKQSLDDKKILDTIYELNNVTQRMNEMLNSVGKEILGANRQEYELVINNQFEILVDFFRNKLYQDIDFVRQYASEDIKYIDFMSVAKIIYDYALTVEIPTITSDYNSKKWNVEYVKINAELFENLQTKLYQVSEKLELSKVLIRQMKSDFDKKVLPFIKNETDKNKVLENISVVIESQLSELPF